MRFAALLALALLVVPTAPGAHPNERREVRANLDGDRELERVVGIANVTSDHSYWRAQVTVVDRCAGRRRASVLVDGYPRLVAASAVQADERGPHEAIGVLRGHEWGSGVARLARLSGRRGRCPSPRTLFLYVAADAQPPPVPELRLSSFGVEIIELATEHPGRELRLTEHFQVRPMLSSTVRETLYRHDRARDRYVAYSTRTYRLP